MTEALIRVDIKDKRFADKRVVSDVTFTISRGEIVSLVGPSGCGKSTVLRIIGGLDRDYDGQVSVLGHEPRLDARDTGFVFQEPRLLPWLTVAQNVGFELGAKGARHPRVLELLAEVGLEDQADAYPKALSGGMAQRAAIARALFGRPALLLLDEPFSAVDAFTRMRLQDLLLSIAAKRDTTLLLVTHDINEAVYLSGRVIALAGRPGRMAGEVMVATAAPREREDPELARAQAQALHLFQDDRVV
ncbi:MAG: sulfonate transporter ATP-binding protein [Caulobacteraceae bacterium]|jgi:sulfonate transport system ATP-binding protein|nr:sulfonate transporter ATP-binding protein [Caulobacteraceae bacterium]